MKATLNLSPLLAQIRDEAAAIGVSYPALLTADLARLRMLAEAATPQLEDWQWELLDVILNGIEARRIILAGADRLPAGREIVAEIDTWVPVVLRPGGDCFMPPFEKIKMEDFMRLRRWAAAWPPLAVAGVLLRLRARALNDEWRKRQQQDQAAT